MAGMLSSDNCCLAFYSQEKKKNGMPNVGVFSKLNAGAVSPMSGMAGMGSVGVSLVRPSYLTESFSPLKYVFFFAQ